MVPLATVAQALLGPRPGPVLQWVQRVPQPPVAEGWLFIGSHGVVMPCKAAIKSRAWKRSRSRCWCEDCTPRPGNIPA